MHASTRSIRAALCAIALSLVVAVPAFAQASLSVTTTAAAVNLTAQNITVASATGFVAGGLAVIDKEALAIQSVNGTVVTVRRGAEGTRVSAHASGAVVQAGLVGYFSNVVPAGVCTASAEPALPRVVLPQVDTYNCQNSQWLRYGLDGSASFELGANTAIVYTASGAITIAPGVQLISVASAGAMTLANPSLAQNGLVMTFISTTAQAHTITYTAGFGGGTTARDVATFAATINTTFQIVAINGLWYPMSTYLAATAVVIA